MTLVIDVPHHTLPNLNTIHEHLAFGRRGVGERCPYDPRSREYVVVCECGRSSSGRQQKSAA